MESKERVTAVDRSGRVACEEVEKRMVLKNFCEILPVVLSLLKGDQIVKQVEVRKGVGSQIEKKERESLSVG